MAVAKKIMAEDGTMVNADFYKKPLKKMVKKTLGNRGDKLAKKQLTGKIMLTKAMKPFGK